MARFVKKNDKKLFDFPVCYSLYFSFRLSLYKYFYCEQSSRTIKYTHYGYFGNDY